VTVQDSRDWFIIGAITAVIATLWLYLFKHPDISSFVTGCTTSVSILGLYHWFVIYDDKKQDAH